MKKYYLLCFSLSSLEANVALLQGSDCSFASHGSPMVESSTYSIKNAFSMYQTKKKCASWQHCWPSFGCRTNKIRASTEIPASAPAVAPELQTGRKSGKPLGNQGCGCPHHQPCRRHRAQAALAEHAKGSVAGCSGSLWDWVSNVWAAKHLHTQLVSSMLAAAVTDSDWKLPLELRWWDHIVLALVAPTLSVITHRLRAWECLHLLKTEHWGIKAWNGTVTVPAETNGNRGLPDITSKRWYTPPQDAGLNNNHSNHKYVSALWLSPGLSAGSRTVCRGTVFPCTIRTSCDCAPLQTVAHVCLREDFKTEEPPCIIIRHSFIFLEECKCKGDFDWLKCWNNYSPFCALELWTQLNFSLLLSKEPTLQDNAEFPVPASWVRRGKPNNTFKIREFTIHETFSPRKGNPHFRGQKQPLRKEGPCWGYPPPQLGVSRLAHGIPATARADFNERVGAFVLYRW